MCTYRLNWARRTSWGWWDDWDDTVLQTQDSKFEPWRSDAEHATSRSQRLPTILTFTRGWGRNIFVSFKPPRPGTEPRTLAWKAAVLTTTLRPPPHRKVIIFCWWLCIFANSSHSLFIVEYIPIWLILNYLKIKQSQPTYFKFISLHNSVAGWKCKIKCCLNLHRGPTCKRSLLISHPNSAYNVGIDSWTRLRGLNACSSETTGNAQRSQSHDWKLSVILHWWPMVVLCHGHCEVSIYTRWSVLPCKVRRQCLLTLQVSRYCLLASRGWVMEWRNRNFLWDPNVIVIPVRWTSAGGVPLRRLSLSVISRWD